MNTRFLALLVVAFLVGGVYATMDTINTDASAFIQVYGFIACAPITASGSGTLQTLGVNFELSNGGSQPAGAYAGSEGASRRGNA